MPFISSRKKRIGKMRLVKVLKLGSKSKDKDMQ